VRKWKHPKEFGEAPWEYEIGEAPNHQYMILKKDVNTIILLIRHSTLKLI